MMLVGEAGRETGGRGWFGSKDLGLHHPFINKSMKILLRVRSFLGCEKASYGKIIRRPTIRLASFWKDWNIPILPQVPILWHSRKP